MAAESAAETKAALAVARARGSRATVACWAGVVEAVSEGRLVAVAKTARVAASRAVARRVADSATAALLAMSVAVKGLEAVAIAGAVVARAAVRES